MKSQNLLKDQRLPGTYLFKKTNGRFYAMIKFYPGYNKTKLFFTEEEATNWVLGNYDSVKEGYYDDEITESRIRLKYYGPERV